jgi:ATP-dependent protease ClpP protease subunit
MINKTKAAINFKAQADENALVLDMCDVIGGDMFDMGITSGMIKDALEQNPSCTSITLNLNSPGGDAFEGVAIYNTLKAAGKPVCVNVIGMAASAASIVAMAGDEVIMNLGTQMMIHGAMAICAGFSADMRKMADTLDQVSGSIADIYVAETGNSKKSVMAMMDAETWMSAKEAVENGFATSTGAANRVENSFDLKGFRFKNTPKELLDIKAEAKTKEVDGESLTSGDFIWVGDPDKTDTWALPWHFSTEEKTQSHLRAALSRFDQEEKIPASQKPEAWAKLVRLAKEHGIDVKAKRPSNEAVVEFDDTELQLELLEIERRR